MPVCAAAPARAPDAASGPTCPTVLATACDVGGSILLQPRAALEQYDETAMRIGRAVIVESGVARRCRIDPDPSAMRKCWHAQGSGCDGASSASLLLPADDHVAHRRLGGAVAVPLVRGSGLDAGVRLHLSGAAKCVHRHDGWMLVRPSSCLCRHTGREERALHLRVEPLLVGVHSPLQVALQVRRRCGERDAPADPGCVPCWAYRHRLDVTQPLAG